MKAAKLRQLILDAEDIAQPESIVIPEWGIEKEGLVFIRQLTALEADRFNLSILADDGKTFSREQMQTQGVRLIALCLVDADGTRIFPTNTLEQLGKKSPKVMKRVADICRKVNAIDELTDEELEKNGLASDAE